MRRALALALLALGLWSSPAHAQPVATDRAGQLYAEGREAFVAGDAPRALLLLEASNAIDPSPNTDLLLGHTLTRLDRPVEALLAYESAIARAAGAPRYAETATEAATRRAELLPRVGRVEVAGRPGLRLALERPRVASVEVDGSTTVYSLPGIVTARWVTADGRTIERTATVEAGVLVKLIIEETPGVTTVIDRTVSPWLPTGVVLASAGGVSLAVAGILGGVTLGVYDDLEACTAEPCGTDSAASLRDEGTALQLATNVTLAAGGALVVAGAIMIVVTLVTDEPAPVTPVAGGIAISF